MTKKHYEAIAKVIYNRVVLCEGNKIVLAGLYYTTVDLANYFAKENPRFDRRRFLKACGIES